MKSHNVILVGFMGTGKTTVGRLLAKQLGWKQVDTDEYIVNRAGCSIPEIFDKHGERYFRKLESDILEEILTGHSNQVVTTGGGAVLAEQNRIAMLANGTVIALKAAKEVIINRVQEDRNRPLLAGQLEDRIQTLLEERRNAYDFADIHIDTSHLTVDEIVERIKTQIKK